MEDVSESDLEEGKSLRGGKKTLFAWLKKYIYFKEGLQSLINARNPQKSSFIKVTNLTLSLGLMRDTIKKHRPCRLNPATPKSRVVEGLVKKAELRGPFWRKGSYSLFHVSHSGTSQTWASVNPCMRKRVDGAFLSVLHCRVKLHEQRYKQMRLSGFLCLECRC